MNIAVIGAQWGDEGKGKLIDIFSEKADITVRFQGGNNAGHTVVVDQEEYIFHLIPSAILHKNKICVIGNGTVIDPESLLLELEELRKRNIIVTPKQLKISGHSHIVMPYHRILDGLRESKRKNKIGTTGRGIGPCYADKVSRCGIRMIDLLNPRILKEKLQDNLKEKNEIFKRVYQSPPFFFAAIYHRYHRYGQRLAAYICDTAMFIAEAIDKKKSVLFEGAQGTFLDIDFGTYPFVTSSNCVVGGACIGSGVSPLAIDKIIAAVKAYTTRVGEGPFPTEFPAGLRERIRAKGNEFGATTGRPRRCGWFDGVQVRYSILLNGVSELAIMKLDVLDHLEKIKICIGYSYKNKIYNVYPMDFEVISKARPIYEEMEGWQQETHGIRQYIQLPLNARRYLNRLEQLLKVKIKYISTGSQRSDFIIR